MKVSKLWPGFLVAGVMSIGVLAGGISPAFAQAATPTPQVTADKLEKAFASLQKRLTAEQKVVDRAARFGDRIQAAIDKRKAAGKDTSKLEAALARFRDAVAKATTHYNNAKSAIDGRTGFDANGKVTDWDQAKTTVQTARKGERQFRNIMRNVVKRVQTVARRTGRATAAGR